MAKTQSSDDIWLPQKSPKNDVARTPPTGHFHLITHRIGYKIDSGTSSHVFEDVQGRDTNLLSGQSPFHDFTYVPNSPDQIQVLIRHFEIVDGVTEVRIRILDEKEITELHQA